MAGPPGTSGVGGQSPAPEEAKYCQVLGFHVLGMGASHISTLNLSQFSRLEPDAWP